MAKKGVSNGLNYLQEHIGYSSQYCLIWPFGRDNHGYGQLSVGGKWWKAHAWMCVAINGPRPSPEHQASHSCGNGHKGCVNPLHLSWKTRSENHLDRRRHGTAVTTRCGNRPKITPRATAQIIALKGKCSQETVAQAFDISKPTVRRIWGGKTKYARAAMGGR